MQHEVGSIIEGKVSGITKFGAFVELEGGGTGMVHISEISQSYVNDIADYLKEGDTVRVKILNVGPEGKISLSIKRALPPDPNAPARPGSRPGGNFGQNRSGPPQNRGGVHGGPNGSRGGFGGGRGGPGGGGRAPSGSRGALASKDDSFEGMLSRFMKQSDDKISDMKQPERRRGYNKKDSRDYES